MADAPGEVVEAARVIAMQTKDTLRKVIAEEFPKLDDETLNDFTHAICMMMAGVA
jgi:hypothetical protein